MNEFHTIYLMSNNNWTYENKSKFGYIYGNTKHLMSILNTGYHSQSCYFIKVWLIEKTYSYKLKDINKMLSILPRNIWQIHIVEDIYNTKLPILKTLNKYMVKDKLFSQFIYNNGICIFEKFIKLELNKLGLRLIKTYLYEEIETINYSARELYKTRQLKIQKNYFLKITSLSISNLKKN